MYNTSVWNAKENDYGNSLDEFFDCLPCCFLASFIDAIAGGGLISLPAYLVAGIPVHFAIATNKLSSTTGTVCSTSRLIENKYADMKIAIPSMVAALTGSVIGTNAALHTSWENIANRVGYIASDRGIQCAHTKKIRTKESVFPQKIRGIFCCWHLQVWQKWI